MNYAVLLPLLAAFVIAAGTSALLTPVVRRTARAIGLVAAPNAERWHRSSTSLLGGVAIWVAFVVSSELVGRFMIGAPWYGSRHGGTRVGLLVAATVMFLTGLIDDRFKLRPASKLIAQASAAAILVTSGIVYALTPWYAVNAVITVFWFLAVTNALNLLDNMDGVAAGVGGLAALFLGISFALHGRVLLSAACFALAGAVAGFLPYNFHPASIFMGDSGSLFIGSLLAGLGAAYPGTVSVGIVPVLFVPVVIVIIPILDTMLVTTTRTLAGRPISMGGRDHTAHRLVAMGLSERQVALLFYGTSAVAGAVALTLGKTGYEISAFVGFLFLIGLSVVAAYLGKMQAYTANEARANSRITIFVSDLFHKKRALEVLLDLLLFALAYYGAYLLRWDGVLPASQQQLLERTLAIAIVAKSIAFGVSGVYRGTWQQASVADAHRIIKASVLGSLLTLAILVLLFRESDFARGILIIDGVLAALLTGGARLSFRSLDRVRRAHMGGGEPALIYGAGEAAELLIRELTKNRAYGIRPIGLVDDDPRKQGSSIHGVPIMGSGRQLPALTQKYRVRKILIGTRQLSPTATECVRECCRVQSIEVLQFKLRFDPVAVQTETVLSARIVG